MKKLLKVVSGILGVLLVLAAVVAMAVYSQSEQVANRKLDIAVTAVSYDTSLDALVRGKHLFETRGCAECHGADGNGSLFINEPNGLYVKSPNITVGANSAAHGYGEADWVRAIRHGVAPQGRALFIMPSEDYNRLTDADLAALVAYLRSLPPGDGNGAIIKYPFIVRALYAFGVIKDAAAKIDHKLPPSKPVPEGPTAEYGAYIANMCMGCHGSGFSGGPIPGGPPNWPPAANLTPGEGSAIARYPNADALKSMLRSGVRSDGTSVSTVMPFKSLSKMSDVEVEALYAFLKTLPPRPAGNR